MSARANATKRANKQQVLTKRRRIDGRKERGEIINYKEDLLEFCLKHPKHRDGFKKEIKRSAVKYLRTFFNSYFPGQEQKSKKMSKDAIVDVLLDKYYGKKASFLRREEEEKNMADLGNMTFKFYLNGTIIPLEIVRYILSFRIYNSQLLYSIGSVNSSWYITLLSSWNSCVFINSGKVLMDISLIVLKCMKCFSVGSKIRVNELDYLFEKCDLGIVKEIRLDRMTKNDFGVFIRRLKKKRIIMSKCEKIVFPIRVMGLKKELIDGFCDSFPILKVLVNPIQRNWKKLNIRQIVFSSSYFKFVNFFNCEKLTKLSLGTGVSEYFLNNCSKFSNLEELKITCNGYSGFDGIKDLTKSLRVLDFSVSYYSSGMGNDVEFFPVLPNVTKVLLDNVPPKYLSIFFEEYTSLRKIVIRTPKLSSYLYGMNNSSAQGDNDRGYEKLFKSIFKNFDNPSLTPNLRLIVCVFQFGKWNFIFKLNFNEKKLQIVEIDHEKIYVYNQLDSANKVEKTIPPSIKSLLKVINSGYFNAFENIFVHSKAILKLNPTLTHDPIFDHIYESFYDLLIDIEESNWKIIEENTKKKNVPFFVHFSKQNY